MPVRAYFIALWAVLPWLISCGPSAADRTPPPEVEAKGPDGAQSSAVARADRPRVIFLGDSLTAGLGLDTAQSFPALIQRRLDEAGWPYEVVNAGVSGDTAAGGLRRLEWAMADGDSQVLIVALGGNDGLRGLPPEQLETNLSAIVEKGLERRLTVILAGMEAPPNFGADYTARFRQVYVSLAARYKVRLIPFLLEGVAGQPALNQPDGIHPNPEGAARVADLVWRTLEPVLDRQRAKASR
ncbi:MAG: arylesterase [Acidobacteriota bacterium]